MMTSFVGKSVWVFLSLMTTSVLAENLSLNVSRRSILLPQPRVAGDSSFTVSASTSNADAALIRISGQANMSVQLSFTPTTHTFSGSGSCNLVDFVFSSSLPGNAIVLPSSAPVTVAVGGVLSAIPTSALTSNCPRNSNEFEVRAVPNGNTSQARSASLNFTTWQIKAGLSVIEMSGLAFGKGVTGDGPKTLPPDSTGGRVKFRGEPRTEVSISLPTSVPMNRSGGGQIAVTNFQRTSGSQIGSDGTLEIFIGAQRDALPANQLPGDYTGVAPILISYPF